MGFPTFFLEIAKRINELMTLKKLRLDYLLTVLVILFFVKYFQMSHCNITISLLRRVETMFYLSRISAS